MRSQGVIWVPGWLPVTISHHPAKFGGYRPCRRGYIVFLIWHVTSCDHVIKESHNLILGFFSPHISTLQRLLTIRLLEKEIFCFKFAMWPPSEWQLTSRKPLSINNCILKKLHDFFLSRIFLRKMSCSFKVSRKTKNFMTLSINDFLAKELDKNITKSTLVDFIILLI